MDRVGGGEYSYKYRYAPKHGRTRASVDVRCGEYAYEYSYRYERSGPVGKRGYEYEYLYKHEWGPLVRWVWNLWKRARK